jgi:hypothetical protein
MLGDLRGYIRRWQFQAPGLLTLLAVTAVFLSLHLQAWPMAGHDYLYFLPRMLDVHLHYLCNGPSIQWWTASFGGGLPGFANPQHTQFMPAQFMVFLLEPWSAVLVSGAMLNAFGFLLIERFVREQLHHGRLASITAAGVFATNGFEFHHTLVGHVAFATWPLLAILPWGFAPTIPAVRRVALLALSGTAIILAGGYVIIVIWGLTGVLVLSALSCYAPSSFPFWRRLFEFAAATVLTVLAASPKLAAIAEFMRYFPHDFDNTVTGTFLSHLTSVWTQLSGWRVATAIRHVFGTDFNLLRSFPSRLLFESDTSITPVAWVSLFAVGFPILYAQFRSKANPANWFRAGLLVALVWVLIELIAGSGPVATIFKQLPLFRSIHANHRLASIFILPLALGTGLATTRILRGCSTSSRVIAGIAFVTLSIATLFPFYKLKYRWEYYRFNTASTTLAWEESRHGERFRPIVKLASLTDDAVFRNRASNLNLYEPVFGYGELAWHSAGVQIAGPDFRTTLTVGPIWPNGLGGASNFHHPVSFSSPFRAGVDAFDKAPSSESRRIETLLNRQQPDWELGTPVSVCFVISGITCVGLVISLIPADYRFARFVRGIATRSRRMPPLSP